MAVDVKPLATLYIGNLTGSSIDERPITITSVEGDKVNLKSRTGIPVREAVFTTDANGASIQMNGKIWMLFVNEVERKFGPMHGMGRRRKTRRRRHQRKTRRSRK
jgi:hypothetical protein